MARVSQAAFGFRPTRAIKTKCVSNTTKDRFEKTLIIDFTWTHRGNGEKNSSSHFKVTAANLEFTHMKLSGFLTGRGTVLKHQPHSTVSKLTCALMRRCTARGVHPVHFGTKHTHFHRAEFYQGWPVMNETGWSELKLECQGWHPLLEMLKGCKRLCLVCYQDNTGRLTAGLQLRTQIFEERLPVEYSLRFIWPTNQWEDILIHGNSVCISTWESQPPTCAVKSDLVSVFWTMHCSTLKSVEESHKNSIGRIHICSFQMKMTQKSAFM